MSIRYSRLPAMLMLMVQGFACGWIYIFGFMVDFANKAVTFSHYMSYWTEKNDRNTLLEITLFFIVPILANILNDRKYGEVEYWLIAFKSISIMGIILVASCFCYCGWWLPIASPWHQCGISRCGLCSK